MSMTSYEECKMVLCGSGAVGKSCVTIQMIQNYYCGDAYDPTIEDSYRKSVSVDGKVTMLDILDTAGQEEFSVMRDMYMRTGEAFLLVYSITSRFSFDEVAKFHEQILRVKDASSVPMVLIGNKCDLEDQREVMRTEGATLAKQWGIPFFETSASERINIEEAFFECVRAIRDTRGGRRLSADGKPSKRTGKSNKNKGACNIL